MHVIGVFIVDERKYQWFYTRSVTRHGCFICGYKRHVGAEVYAEFTFEELYETVAGTAESWFIVEVL